MLSKVYSASILGVEASIVEVEVDMSNGLPVFHMTGYLGARVREAEDRVKTAVKNVNHPIPSSHIVINVSPASIRKSGTMLDLPIAVGILADMEIIRKSALEEFLIVGELSLDGKVNPIPGVLAMVHEAKKRGIKKAIVPVRNLMETELMEDMMIVGAGNLAEVIDVMNDDDALPVGCPRSSEGLSGNEPDFCEVKGQEMAKQAILIAACGRHNLLMSGPPGTGKTLLASRIPSILPRLTNEEMIEISKIYSICGLLDHSSVIRKRPFRAPHHTISDVAMLGGGAFPVPGEITLAHRGVLFLDELTLFRPFTLESMRQPLEEGEIKVIRNGISVNFPSDLMLVAAMNPCKCGYYPDRSRCRCTDYDIKRHIGHLSKPFLDRFDLMVHVDKPKYQELVWEDVEEAEACKELRILKDPYSSKSMQKVVERVVAIQKERYRKEEFSYNKDLPAKALETYCVLDGEGRALLKRAYEKYSLSARGYNKIIKVARTIADMEGEEYIRAPHVSEAIILRNLEESEM
ncbi:MAG: YifB family Mg chelatase-like AAA ATPase [Lachnospiraceae bacterium]|nr:YifB family Mg chelatase-like AAA ATPase [Lachnospiraceae bacterium]